jgi:tRNA uridine 5-carboxymethylaminomethyl modification enzyme
MFTSRAEFRLHLRIDNADARLTPVGEEIGLATAERREFFASKSTQVLKLRRMLETSPKGVWLRSPESKIAELAGFCEQILGEPPQRGVLMTVETEIKYAGYIDQQLRQMDKMRGSDTRPIPASMEFTMIPGISREVAEKLTRVRPVTLGQASRIPGVTPAAMAILDIHLTLAGSRV